MEKKWFQWINVIQDSYSHYPLSYCFHTTTISSRFGNTYSDSLQVTDDIANRKQRNSNLDSYKKVTDM